MSNILTGFNMQGNDPIDNRIVSPSKFETLEEYLQRVPIQKRYYGLSFYALDEDNKLRHYTFQTSLIDPTIDDDEEEIERLDEELKKHVNNKEIHKTSEEIRSEIVDADIPDTIARVQWTLNKIEEAVNTVMNDIVDGASDEYNTLKKIQDKIVELRTEMESQLYGDDGGNVLKTLEQALKFLNQYKDFIVDIPDNYVNKQDIVDNLNTDDPTKVLSARQGKVLSETLTNYFDSAMASIRAETNRATNAENRIEAKLDDEIDRSTAEDIRIQSELDAEEARAQSEEKRIEDKLDAEIERSTTKDTELGNQIIAETDRAEGEEQRIETKLDNEITRSTAKDEEHDDRIKALEGDTHVQNTDVGTTSQTFQLQLGKPGNKIKNEDAAISVRNADDSDYVNFIAKNATFKGDLIVEGQSFVTEAETVEIKDNILLLNKGEIGSGVTKGMAGLQIDRGTQPDFQILFVESDRRFKAGEEGNLQCLALRDEDGDMLDGMFTTWDSATHRLKTTNIIPSTRKLFFNTNANSLGYTSHVYDNTYTADSFTFTKEAGSLFFSAGTTNLNLDTDKTYFRFYKNLMIPSSIISSRTSISLLNASGATIATFGSPSTINSTLNVANQVTIKGGSDIKLKMQSADADNFNLIESQNSSGTKLSTFGYYGTFWGIDGYSIATESWSNNKFLPLAGGTMTGVILMNNNVVIQSKNSSGTAKRLIGKGSDNITYIGDSDGHTFLYSDAADIIHVRNGTNYTIYDSYNFNPGNYLPLTGGNLSGNLYMNNALVATQSWVNSQGFLKSVSGYLPLTGGTMKGSIRFPAESGIIGNADGTSDTYILRSFNNQLDIGSAALSTRIISNASDLLHHRLDTSYKIWDAYNLPTPASTTDLAGYLPLSGGTLTGTLVVNANNHSGNFDEGIRINAVGSDWATLFVGGSEVSGSSNGWIIGRNPSKNLLLGFQTSTESEGFVLYSDGSRPRWKNNQLAYLGDIPSLSGYATQSWVNSQGFLKSADMSGYATQSWVTSQGYYKSGSSYPLFTSGVYLAANAGTTGGWARAYWVGNSSSTGATGVGFGGYGNGDTPNYAYIGVGSNVSYASVNNLKIYTDKVTFGNKTLATTDLIPSIPSITISNSGSGNAVTAITASGHTLTVTKGATYLTSSSLSGYATQSWVTSQGYLTSSSLSGYATQTWVNNKNYAVRESDNVLIFHSNEFNFTASSNTSIAINYRGGSGSYTSAAITEYRFYNGQGSFSNVNILANSFTGSLIGNASSATKLGSSTVGGTAKPIYLSSGTATACSATVGSSTVPVYMSAGTITQCSTTLGVSITGNAATATTATNSNNLGGYAAATYVKSTSTTKVQDIQVVTTAGSTTGVLYVVLES